MVVGSLLKAFGKKIISKSMNPVVGVLDEATIVGGRASELGVASSRTSFKSAVGKTALRIATKPIVLGTIGALAVSPTAREIIRKHPVEATATLISPVGAGAGLLIEKGADIQRRKGEDGLMTLIPNSGIEKSKTLGTAVLGAGLLIGGGVLAKRAIDKVQDGRAVPKVSPDTTPEGLLGSSPVQTFSKEPVSATTKRRKRRRTTPQTIMRQSQRVTQNINIEVDN